MNRRFKFGVVFFVSSFVSSFISFILSVSVARALEPFKLDPSWGPHTKAITSVLNKTSAVLEHPKCDDAEMKGAAVILRDLIHALKNTPNAASGEMLADLEKSALNLSHSENARPAKIDPWKAAALVAAFAKESGLQPELENLIQESFVRPAYLLHPSAGVGVGAGIVVGGSMNSFKGTMINRLGKTYAYSAEALITTFPSLGVRVAAGTLFGEIEFSGNNRSTSALWSHWDKSSGADLKGGSLGVGGLRLVRSYGAHPLTLIMGSAGALFEYPFLVKVFVQKEFAVPLMKRDTTYLLSNLGLQLP